MLEESELLERALIRVFRLGFSAIEEILMASIADLQTAAQSLQQAATDVQAAVDELKSRTNLSGDDQAALDAAVSQVEGSASSLSQFAASLSANAPPPAPPEPGPPGDVVAILPPGDQSTTP